MKVLVTGGAGYIGSHVAQALRDAGHQVVIYDNLSSGRRQAALGGVLVVADLHDEQALAGVFDEYGFDAVMHFAASIFVEESVSHPLAYYHNNVAGLLALLRECRRCAVAYAVFSSSAAVYAPSDKPTSEDAPCKPSNPYGWSKAMSEQILLDDHRAGGANYAVLRYYNAAGADLDGRLGPSGPAQHLIKVAVRAANGGDGMTINGTDYDTPDGTCIRDYVHVADLARIHVAALEHLAAGGDPLLLNCGYGRGYSVREVIAACKRVTGVDFSVREGARRAGDVPFLVADTRRLCSVLNFTPGYDDIGLTVRTAWEWEQKLQEGVWRD